MLQLVNKLTFLEDITEELKPKHRQTRLFKDAYRAYRVKDCPEITFKISSDWSGNWLAGNWYSNDIKIRDPDELMTLLSKADIITMAFHLDILEEISSWNKDKFITVGAIK